MVRLSMPHLRFTETEIRDAVSKSVSIRETMVRLGYKQFAGGSHSCLSRKIKKWGIDTTHFLGQRASCGERKIGGPARKKSADELLIYHANGRRGKTNQLKRALIEKGHEVKCYMCGLSS